MTQTRTIQVSIANVRQRLWMLLLRAFGLMVLTIVALTLAATFVFINRQTSRNQFYTAPVAYLLEAYYQGHGSWDGVERLFGAGQDTALPAITNEWKATLLLDVQNRVVFDQGLSTGERIGQIYAKSASDHPTVLSVNGQRVGALVYVVRPFSLVLNLMAPIALISLLLGSLTVLIGLLLMRRVVDPLAEVIAAASAVACGDLGARVPLHRHHDDLYALSDSFNQMAEALERSDQERKAMLADIAHELRTPLSILRGRLEGILDGIYSADAAHIAPALEEVYLLEQLVDELRLLTLAEARQLPLEMRDFNLFELAEKVTATFAAEAEELNIKLLGLSTGDKATGAQTMVHADPQRMEQVIGNLIGNALRYTPGGSTVMVHVTTNDEWVRLGVADDGPGVPEADLPYLFDRFWRGEKSRTRAAGGMGLGLAIARQLIEAQDGEMWAKNLDEGGFEVGFRLKRF